MSEERCKFYMQVKMKSLKENLEKIQYAISMQNRKDLINEFRKFRITKLTKDNIPSESTKVKEGDTSESMELIDSEQGENCPICDKGKVIHKNYFFTCSTKGCLNVFFNTATESYPQYILTKIKIMKENHM